MFWTETAKYGVNKITLQKWVWVFMFSERVIYRWTSISTAEQLHYFTEHLNQFVGQMQRRRRRMGFSHNKITSPPRSLVGVCLSICTCGRQREGEGFGQLIMECHFGWRKGQRMLLKIWWVFGRKVQSGSWMTQWKYRVNSSSEC